MPEVGKLGRVDAMKPNYKSYAVFTVLMLMLTALSGCVAQEKASASTGHVPVANLPEGFKLIAVLGENTQGINMTDEIKKFYGTRDIGPVTAEVGKYQWGTPGENYDAKITVIQAQDEDHAKVAVSNYRSLPEFQKDPFKNVKRFSTAVINGHDALEIRKSVGDSSIRFLYLWNTGSTVVLVEGNDDRSKSLELASATGL
jgi:hypothetical protein